MGLDGISVNQLRISPDNNSAELNSTVALPVNETRAVDGLSNGQRVNPDKEHEKNDAQYSNRDKHESDIDDTDENDTVTKYDLSETNKYAISLDEVENRIVITEKATGEIIQTIDADTILQFVEYSPNTCGSIISKKL